ncbi:MAG: beta-ketoacyl synthase N-terminal-like domain-containing protein, partial [Acidobacteriota bacterium]
MPRIGIYGWGVVAPRSPDVDAFARNLQGSESWLTPFEGYGPSTFLVGEPEFDFEAYRDWIDERFPPSKFPQLSSKMGATTQYAIGAFIQSLGQNPGIESVLQELGADAQVLVGTGLGELPTAYDCSVELYRAQRRWDRFWAQPERNADRRRYEEGDTEERAILRESWGIPPEPGDPGEDPEVWEFREVEWCSFWMRRSDALQEFLDTWDEIESEGVQGPVDSGKLSLIRRKRTALERLQQQWGCPRPPWMSVSANLLWNIHNTPASQVSMLGRITGPAYAPVAACSTFGVSLHLAVQAIRAGEARAAVVGATDPPPHATSVGSFYAARVLAANRDPSVPLTDLRGTHVAGGSCVWIVADKELMDEHGFEPLGLEILGVGVTSDADHIITPSAEGPREAIGRAAGLASRPGDPRRHQDLVRDEPVLGVELVEEGAEDGPLAVDAGREAVGGDVLN